jgi:hypothetical protein
VPRPLGLDFDDLPHKQWNAWLAQDAEKRFAALRGDGREDHEKAWNKSMQERDEGVCEGPYTIEELDSMFGDRWRGSRRFPVWQKGALRVCDDDAENLGNESSTQHDKLRTQRADVGAKSSIYYGERIGEATRGWSLGIGTDDVKGAYRRVLVATRSYSVAVIVDPSAGRAMGFVFWGFTFGKVSAVLYFNAVPAIVAKVSRRLMGAVTDHYFDDFVYIPLTMLNGVTILGSDTACNEAVADVMRATGLPFSDAKHVPVLVSGVFGGVLTSFRRLAREGKVELSIAEERRALVSALADSALTRCSPRLAAEIRGKVWWASEWTPGRASRAVLQPLTVRAC